MSNPKLTEYAATMAVGRGKLDPRTENSFPWRELLALDEIFQLNVEAFDRVANDSDVPCEHDI